MPRFDQRCPTCQWQGEVIVEPFVNPACPTCGGQTERLWVSSADIHGDEIPGGLEIENLGPDPITFYSKSEIVKEARRRGLEPMVRHVPLPGTDRSPYTTNWAVASPWMLEQAKVLLERVERERASSPQPEPDGPGAITAAQVKAIVERRWPSLS